MKRRTFLTGLLGAVAAAVGAAKGKGVPAVPPVAPTPVGPVLEDPWGMATSLEHLCVSEARLAWLDPAFIVKVNGRPYVEGDTIYAGDVLSYRRTS